MHQMFRAVARSENPGGGGHVVLGGDNVPPLVEIGLTDLPKSGGGAQAPPAPPLATGLRLECLRQVRLQNLDNYVMIIYIFHHDIFV